MGLYCFSCRWHSYHIKDKLTLPISKGFLCENVSSPGQSPTQQAFNVYSDYSRSLYMLDHPDNKLLARVLVQKDVGKFVMMSTNFLHHPNGEKGMGLMLRTRGSPGRGVQDLGEGDSHSRNMFMRDSRISSTWVEVTWPRCRHFRQFGQLQVEKILRGDEKYNKREVSSWWHCLPYQLSTGRALRVELESFQCTWSGNQALSASPVSLFLARSNVTKIQASFIFCYLFM